MSEKEINAPVRPPLLSALCILTFIGSTTAFIGYFVAAIYFEQVSQLILQYSSWHTTEAITPLYFTLLMALYAFSLAGAIRMWKQHRGGFIFYTVAQLLILLLPVIWIDSQAFSFTNLIFVTVFVSGYAMNLKRMK